MKATDICVGDWLNIYTFPNDNPKQDDLFPAKVSAVSVFDPFKDPDDVTVELVIPNTDGIASRPLNTCLPIKLTEEILVKNGWDFRDRQYAIECEEDEQGIVELSRDKDGYYWSINWDEYQIIRIHYVHELQHILRLCGIEKEIEL